MSRTIRRTLASAGAAAALVAGTAVVATAPAPPAAALTQDQATTAFDAFVDTFWDAERGYFFTWSDRVVHPEHAHGPEGGLYTDFWWEAQLWEMVMDRYERAGDDESRAMIDEVWEGFRAAYPDWRENDWNDDIGWWARGAVRAYELTGEQRYLDASIEMFDFISQYEDEQYGGGIWWKNVDIGNGSANQKNVATNGTAIQIAVMLAEATGDETYLATAERLFAWLDDRFLIEDGRLRDNISGPADAPVWADWVFTYNQGGYAGAALALHRATGDDAYLAQSRLAIDWSIANITNAGVLKGEGTGDGGGFRAVLTRNVRELIDDAALASADRAAYEAFLTRNASQAVNAVNSIGIGGYDWSQPAPEEPIQSLAAGTTAAIAQQAAPDGATGPGGGSTLVYEAENARLDGVNWGTAHRGYTGRGFVEKWIAGGSSVSFDVWAAKAGDRELVLRYAAGAGRADRALEVNGDRITRFKPFTATSGWSDWREHRVTVPLAKGHNEIRLSAPEYGAWLSLDSLTLSRR
jgi:predicted alpha-1,6-mannanase (GH76 family)